MHSSILIVEDDEISSNLMADYLRGSGFTVTCVANKTEAQNMLADGAFDVALVDLGLPDGDGLSLARDIAARSDVGVIIVSARGDAVDRIVGIEAGADDYLPKPVNLRELLARVRAVQRRRAGASPESGDGQDRRSGGARRFRGFELDPTLRVVRQVNGEIIRMTTSEFELLASLAKSVNEPVSRLELTRQVFNRSWTPEDRAIDRLVASAREKLGDDASDPRILITVRGRGYQLVG